MIAWIATLGLRVKLYALIAFGVISTIGYLYLRWSVASRKAESAEAKARQLEAARKAELRIAERRAALADKQRKIRAKIAAETGRDGFSDQGWGP